MSDGSNDQRGPDAVHAADRVHARVSYTDPLAPPIYQTTVYRFPDTASIDAIHDGERDGYIYGRYGLPNAVQLAQALAELEGAEAGFTTTSATSGILATLLTLAQTGDRVVVGHNTYGGTRGILDNEFRRFGVSTDYVDLTDLDAVASALDIQPTPALLWADTISNPTIITNDIPALAQLAKQHGVRFVVDNTFATPVHFNPLRHGADLVIHSGTKFIGGHNDVSSGAVLGGANLVDRIKSTSIRTGAIGSSFDAWLTLRGLRTLDVRMARSSATALAVARVLDAHPRVHHVHYPGLESDPRHEVAERMLCNGFGSILSADFGDEATLRHVVDSLKTIAIAETLGGVMTTVVLPRLNYYRHLSIEELQRLGISPGLARFSIGIEPAESLIADLERALAS